MRHRRLPRAELVGKTIPEVTHPDDLAANLALFGPLMRGELPSFTMEKRFFRKDGSVVWTYLTVSLQRDAAGEPAYCIAIVQDISERKRLEEALREGEHRWRSLTEALPQLVWMPCPTAPVITSASSGRSTPGSPRATCWPVLAGRVAPG